MRQPGFYPRYFASGVIGAFAFAFPVVVLCRLFWPEGLPGTFVQGVMSFAFLTPVGWIGFFLFSDRAEDRMRAEQHERDVRENALYTRVRDLERKVVELEGDASTGPGPAGGRAED